MNSAPKTNKDGGDTSKGAKPELATSKNERPGPSNNSKSQTPQNDANRPPDLSDSDWELMKWRNPEKYGKPEFAEENQPDEDNEFVFPRYFHHGAEWKIATHETASHWLTADETYKSKWISTQSITQRPVDRGNLQSRWYEERLEDAEHKFGVSKHGVPVKVGGRGQPPVASITRLDVWRDPSGKLKEFHKELPPTNVHSGKDPPQTRGSRASIHSFEDPYYYGDPYVDDPSKYFREKRKFPNRKPEETPTLESSSSEEEEEEPPKPKRPPKGKPPLDKENVNKNKKPKSPLKSKPPTGKKPPPKRKTPPTPTKQKTPTSNGDRNRTPERKPRPKPRTPPKRKPSPKQKPGTKPPWNSTTVPSPPRSLSPVKRRSLPSYLKHPRPPPPEKNPRPSRPPGRNQPSLGKNRKPRPKKKSSPPNKTDPSPNPRSGKNVPGGGDPNNPLGQTPYGGKNVPGGGNPYNPLGQNPYSGNYVPGYDEPHEPFGQTPHPPDIEKEFDYVYFNARRACTLPPNKPVPVYVDDPKGSRHNYCPSGLACHYVNKSDYGKIPDYLKQVNKEQGRPEEPDFRRFYSGGRARCRVCGNTRYPRRRCEGQMGGEGKGQPTQRGGKDDNFHEFLTSRGDCLGLPPYFLVEDILEVVRKSSIPISDAGASGHLFPPSMVPRPPEEYRDDECIPLNTDGRGERLQSRNAYQSRRESAQNQDPNIYDDYSIQHDHHYDHQNPDGIADNCDFDPNADLC